MSIRSRLVSQKIISNDEQLFNARNLSPRTFGIILPPNPCGKTSMNSQIYPRTKDENTNSKVHTIRILFDSGASISIGCKQVINFSKLKRINGQPWQGPLIPFL